MPLSVDIRRAVVFGGEREEGLQKTEKLAVFADDLLVVPETADAPSRIRLPEGPLHRVPETLSLDEERIIPVAEEPASKANIPGFVEGATFVSSDLEDRGLNELIYEVSEEHNVLCNIIDVKELCNTWLMSVIDTPHMIAGLSTRGGCAFYAQRSRMELEAEFERRSHVSRVFTELRDGLRDEQCRLCTLDVVYRDDTIQTLLEEERWDEALDRGRTLAEDVPDDYHVMNHSVEAPEEP